MVRNVPVIALFNIWLFDLAPGGRDKNDTALELSCHVVIITTKFGEFLPNRLGGDSMTDGQTDRQADRQSQLQYPPPIHFFKTVG